MAAGNRGHLVRAVATNSCVNNHQWVACAYAAHDVACVLMSRRAAVCLAQLGLVKGVCSCLHVAQVLWLCFTGHYR